MKKILSAIALTAISSTLLINSNVVTPLKADISVDELKTNILNNLVKPVALDVDVTFPMLTDYSMTIECDEDNYYQVIYINNSMVSQIGVAKGSDGNAYKQYLDLSNEVKLEVIMESEELPLLYDTNYDHLFKTIKNVDLSTFDDYFTLENVNSTTYNLMPNSRGVGLLFDDFINFFTDIDGYVWDKHSLEYSFNNLVITTSETGELKNMNFSKIKKDKFGGIRQTYSCAFNQVNSVDGLTPHIGNISQDDKNYLSNSLSTLQNKIDAGNFRQTTIIVEKETDRLAYNYHNFYDLVRNDPIFPNLMISDLALTDSANGDTYLGVIQEGDATFAPYGFSPRTGMFGKLSNDTFPNFKSFLPKIDHIDGDYFTCTTTSDTKEYIFDIKNFRYFDISFAESILNSLFGGFDAMVTYGAFFLDMSQYNYFFNSLSITIDNQNNISFILDFNNEYGNFVATTKYEAFNTVNVKSEQSLSAVIKMIESIANGGY